MPKKTLNLPAADYHAIEAMSAGMAWTMDAECPLKAWLNSPWNAGRVAETAAHFDVGTASHLAVLEPHLFDDRVVAHEFATYQTKEARAIRDAAYEVGKTPLKPEEYKAVINVQEALQRHKLAASLFTEGNAEVSLQWEWNGVPCKARPDYLSLNNKYILDLKTANTANPRALGRKAALEGWHLRACWYMGGCKAVTGTLPERYIFVVVESKPPHIVELVELDDNALTYGEQILMRSVRLFNECMEKKHWPGYGDGSVAKLKLPTWTEFQRAEREEMGEFE